MTSHPTPDGEKSTIDYKAEVLKIHQGAVEMPDASGAPSSDYCIVRPATKEDWPEHRWVSIGPYVSGDPCENLDEARRVVEAIK